jgi:anti-sigma regulatory factor (Ser/Thr protein kinase)
VNPDAFATAGPFVHEAVFYRSDEQYLASLVPFVRTGLGAGEPVLVAVPGRNLDLIGGGLGPDAERVRLVDMSKAGRNPSRIIPWVLHAFLDAFAGQRVRVIGEPVWPERSIIEYPVCVQHEAMINEAFAGREATILCPYDANRLDDVALIDAECTHPVLVEGSARWVSSRYQNPVETARRFNQPLPDPPAVAVTTAFTAATLPRVRQAVRQVADSAGVSDERLDGFELAVHEVAANSVAHGGGGGTLSLWVEGCRVVCEIRDGGHLSDPMTGRRPVPPDRADGRGLLLVHHVCDLVQVHTRPGATTTRLHLRGQRLPTAAS